MSEISTVAAAEKMMPDSVSTFSIARLCVTLFDDVVTAPDADVFITGVIDRLLDVILQTSADLSEDAPNESGKLPRLQWPHVWAALEAKEMIPGDLGSRASKEVTRCREFVTGNTRGNDPTLPREFSEDSIDPSMCDAIAEKLVLHVSLMFIFAKLAEKYEVVETEAAVPIAAILEYWVAEMLNSSAQHRRTRETENDEDLFVKFNADDVDEFEGSDLKFLYAPWFTIIIAVIMGLVYWDDWSHIRNTGYFAGFVSLVGGVLGVWYLVEINYPDARKKIHKEDVRIFAIRPKDVIIGTHDDTDLNILLKPIFESLVANKAKVQKY